MIPDEPVRGLTPQPWVGALSGIERCRAYSRGLLPATPMARLFGYRLTHVAAGTVTLVMPASRWFCAFGPQVSSQAIAALANMTLFSAVVGLHQPGSTTVMLGSSTHFLRQVPADGRRLNSEVLMSAQAPNLYMAEATVRSADGDMVARSVASIMRIDASKRERRQRVQAQRVLATLLFIDIVNSTALAGRMGDTAWRNLLEDFRLKVRREISRFNGIEVDTAGDGFFVRFDSPAYAIDAARAAGAAIRGLAVKLRAGIHTGECELQGTRLAGMAVHIAARTMATAGPGEILVSSTVQQLSGGSGFVFEDRGEHALKGVPDPWRLYAVAD